MGGNEEQLWRENAQNITTLSTLIGMRWRGTTGRAVRTAGSCANRADSKRLLCSCRLSLSSSWCAFFFRNSMNDAIGWFAAWLLFVLLLFLPHYIYVRFFMPYETLSEDETRKFRDLQEH